jgi:GrpB-like predicted nucleotidyltransferase (UPF0157 family)
MLTQADLDWLKHLSNTKKVKIVPYNAKVKEIFSKQKQEVTDILGQNVEVLHRGASGLGISGQDEIDVVIAVPFDRFDITVAKLKAVYGVPDSFYAGARARFNRQHGHTKVELAVVNRDSERWKRSLMFEDYLKKHPEALEAYRKLKEANNGAGLKEYYRRKLEFINAILQKALTHS